VRFHYIYTPDVVDPLWRFNMPATFLFFIPGYALIEAPFLSLRRQWSRSAAPHEETIAAPAGARPATGEAEG
jgi:hypothetical protein